MKGNFTRRLRKKWLVLQYDNRKITPDYKKLMKENKDYAKIHGYDYRFVSKGYMKLPTYWRKVNLVKDLLKGYKGILWIDTDAVVFNNSMTLESIMAPYLSKMFFKSSDNYKVPASQFNGGVWIIKNTPEMNTLMDQWLQLYDPTEWLKNYGGNWHTTGEWSLNTYEQGAFREKIEPLYKKYIPRLPCTVLQGCLEDINTDNEPFIIHFMDSLKSYIPGFVKTFIDCPNKPKK